MVWCILSVYPLECQAWAWQGLRIPSGSSTLDDASISWRVATLQAFKACMTESVKCFKPFKCSRKGINNGLSSSCKYLREFSDYSFDTQSWCNSTIRSWQELLLRTVVPGSRSFTVTMRSITAMTAKAILTLSDAIVVRARVFPLASAFVVVSSWTDRASAMLAVRHSAKHSNAREDSILQGKSPVQLILIICFTSIPEWIEHLSPCDHTRS